MNMDTPSRTLKNLLDKMPIAQSDIPHDGASSWLLDLRFANERYDINEAIEIMESFSPGAERNTQFALTHALLHTNFADSFVLKMLWHYLKEGDRKRLDGLRAQLMPQLEATEYKVRINLNTNDAHHLAVLIMLLDGMGATDIDYSRAFSKLLCRKPDHPEALEGLALIQRLKADEFNRVSSAYLGEHLEQGHELVTQDARRMALIQTLFAEPSQMMSYAAMSLSKTMEGLPREPRLRNPERFLENFKVKIDISIAWIKQSLCPSTEKDLLAEMNQMFFLIMQDDWRQKDNVVVTVQILDYLCEQLDQNQIHWEEPMGRALCRRNRGVYDPIYAAGLSLLKSNNYLVMKTLSHKILGDLNTEELVEKFANKKEVLVEVYKHSGNAELICHMNPKQKHASISHDLGM
jgi:hypothetical protein